MLSAKFVKTNDGQLYKRTAQDVLLRCIDKPTAEKVMEEVHDGDCGPHMNAHALVRKIMRLGYYWTTTETDCCKYVRHCHNCQIFPNIQHVPPSMLYTMTLPWPFSTWGIDIIGKINPSGTRGHCFILVAIDYFTKWVEAKSYKVLNAKDVFKFIQNDIICRYEVPHEFINDYETHFQAETTVILEKYKIKHNKASPYRPQTNGMDIQDSDYSSKYFFAKISERTHQQVIGGIYDHHGKLHMGFSSVSAAFNQYYQDLQGHSSTTTPLDTDFISSGAMVNSSDSHLLIREISLAEIRDALFSMDSNSSPGIDGFSAGMSKQANLTVISLIPKKAIPNAVTDYRPICCCTVFYKTVSKILANRLQSILPSIVGAEQVAFIKGRSIFENIILSQTLVKGYNRANISPRCMIKVDIRKAFDSLQWSFIANMLSGLGFPQQFIDWVLGCIQTPWYSLKLNGELSGFFQGKSGIRQGDPLSPYLFVLSMGDVPSVAAVKSTLSLFAELSELHANIEITCILEGCILMLRRLCLQQLVSLDGQFPFRYLGVPLSTSRVSVAMFDSLILKIKHSIQHWSSNFLTYAGRVQLINSIIFGMETFWCSCNILPHEVLHKINKLCKDFFGEYCLKVEEWCLKNGRISVCPGMQEASISKISPLGMMLCSSHDSFFSSLKGILAVRDRLVALAGSITNASSLINSWCSHGKFRVTAAYSYLRGAVLAGPWTTALTHPRIVPSHKIICSLAAQQKLATVDNLQSRGFYMVNRCSLCEISLEDHAHLFFNCSFSKDVWQQLLQWMGMHRAGSCLLAELEQANFRSKHNWRMAWFCTSLAAAVYQIWNERNSRLFRGRKAAVTEIVSRVKFLVSTRLLMWTSHKEYSILVASL
ncbi:uncharacterized protein LOC141607914 [Silene latifolia]|uniref:uncharacterized protein LOC141607914 n=1 Tax=Silene latifolia TaxID=37657 RepID=UPI003D77BD3A